MPRQSRDETKRGERNESYNPPTMLDSPDLGPDTVCRWIRIFNRGEDDSANFAKKRRMGWEPVRVDEIPDDFHVPTIDDGQHGNHISVGGLVLCKMAKESADQITRYHQGKANQLESSLKNEFLNKENPAMPLHHSDKTTTTKGKQE